MDIAAALADASPIVIVLTFVIMLVRGDITLPRERNAAQARAEEFRVERDKWQTLALETLKVGERIAEKLPERRDP